MTAILLIEDDADVADALSRLFDGRGYDVTIADCGRSGCELAEHRRFDVVLLDLVLPDMEGVELLERLVMLGHSQQVVVLSALSDTQAKVRCLELGAADYLAKPFAFDELFARVRACERYQSAGAERYVRVGNVALDTQRRLALVDGRVVPLSTHEFSLLEALLRRRGEVCSRSQLVDCIGGDMPDRGTNIVDVYVQRLRRKVGKRRIDAIRDVGYRFVGAPETPSPSRPSGAPSPPGDAET